MYFAPKVKLYQTVVITVFQTANGNVRSLKLNNRLGILFPSIHPHFQKLPFAHTTHASQHLTTGAKGNQTALGAKVSDHGVKCDSM